MSILRRLVNWLDVIRRSFRPLKRWEKILVVICVLILCLLQLPGGRQNGAENQSMLPERTPLYGETQKRIEDFYEEIDRNKLNPWLLIHTGKMPEVKDFYGKTIQYRGITKYEGSPRHAFWAEDFIDPFVKGAIICILNDVAEDAEKGNLIPAPCIDEAASLLHGLIGRVYNRMADIDWRLRGRDKSSRKDLWSGGIGLRIKKLQDYVQARKKEITEIESGQSPYAQKEKWWVSKLFTGVVLPIGIAVMVIWHRQFWWLFKLIQKKIAKLTRKTASK